MKKVHFAILAWKEDRTVCLIALSDGKSAQDITDQYAELIDTAKGKAWADIKLVCVRSLDELHEEMYGEPSNAVIKAERKSKKK